MPVYRVTTSRVGSIDELGVAWSELQARTACSFFQSWGWIGTWLRQLVPDLDARVVRIMRDDVLVGIGIFVPRDIRRRLLFSSRALFLNEYPFDGRNMSIEYNGLLAVVEYRADIYRSVVCHLFDADPGLDEVYLGAVDEACVPGGALADTRCAHDRPVVQELEASQTWAVDLEASGPDMKAFIGTLSKNRRTQLRRSIRLYEADGPLRVEVAGDVAEALAYLDELRVFHTARWQRAGGQGVFANPHWGAFHRALISSRFSAGEIQLLRVRNDSSVIGYLYNLVWQDHVHVLQTGFEESDEKARMPGYVVHAMAIGYNMAAGKRRYDLMHGDEQYKRILCRAPYRRLVWLVMQRRRLRFGIERGLLAVKRRLQPPADY